MPRGRIDRRKKRCSKCGRIKTKRYGFCRDGGAGTIDGYHTICKMCQREYGKKWRRDNKEYLIEYDKRYSKTEAGKEAKQRAQKKYRGTKKFHKKNRARCRKYSKTKLGKESKRRRHLKYDFGITEEEYNEILRKQNGLCAICKKLETVKLHGKIKHLAIDHDHETGKIRGLLCGRCNAMIGLAKDDAEVLKSAILYLKENAHATR